MFFYNTVSILVLSTNEYLNHAWYKFCIKKKKICKNAIRKSILKWLFSKYLKGYIFLSFQIQWRLLKTCISVEANDKLMVMQKKI